jgi:hypothetical protein
MKAFFDKSLPRVELHERLLLPLQRFLFVEPTESVMMSSQIHGHSYVMSV